MATAKDLFNYNSEKYRALREPSRGVSAAYSEANKWLDTLKEWVYIEQGMVHLSDLIHELAHKELERLDKFAEILHENHLLQFYPTTEELDIFSEVKDLYDCFDFVIRVIDHIQEKLNVFHKACETQVDLMPMALKTEELMLENSADRTVYLDLWVRWSEDGGSKTSFDKYIVHFKENKN